MRKTTWDIGGLRPHLTVKESASATTSTIDSAPRGQLASVRYGTVFKKGGGGLLRGEESVPCRARKALQPDDHS
jgi:hypothetical protein